MRLGKVVVSFPIREDVRGADGLILGMSDILTPVNLRFALENYMEHGPAANPCLTSTISGVVSPQNHHGNAGYSSKIRQMSGVRGSVCQPGLHEWHYQCLGGSSARYA
jgi:hypothetical protein